MNRIIVLASIAFVLVAGCGGSGEKKEDTFFTSGSREADQRADQRMAQANQLKGEGEGAGDKDAKAQEKQPLYDRLGGNDGLTKIVDDFVTRALADPRVNWERKGITRGGISLSRGKSVEWAASPENVKTLKLHLVQFFAVATGGPAKYEGKEMKKAHERMHITNAEFDAAIGVLKASLDAATVPNQEQRELLAIVESTRTQIVEER